MEIEKKVQSLKYGDIIKLGNNFLIYGDCKDENIINKVLQLNDNKLIDVIITDPPYSYNKAKKGVKNDDLRNDEFYNFLTDYLVKTQKITKDNSTAYIFGIEYKLFEWWFKYLQNNKENNYKFIQNLIWKKIMGPGMNSGLRKFHNTNENIFFFARENVDLKSFRVNACNFNENMRPILKYMQEELKKTGMTKKEFGKKILIDFIGNKTDAMIKHYFNESQFSIPTEKVYKKIQEYFKNMAFKKEYDVLKKEYDVLKKEYDVLKTEWQEARYYFEEQKDMTHILEFTKNVKRYEHPTSKNIDLLKLLIKSTTRENETIIDSFCGSGTIFCAAHDLKRIAFGIELEEKWILESIKRFEDYTNIKVFKI